ncbi:MAG: type I glyceraldehyde-3-phosphate dehydrogenase [Candidatus Berkelbacteria bacterium]|nr:type I glyceraldehyde-3-phosphate dehydrogenase [Candidatus Berkelbacteria bacterium]
MKVAINGFGRIGRAAAKIILNSDDLELVAINDLTDPETLLFLFQHDSCYPAFEKKIEISDGKIKIGDQLVHFFAEREPEKLPWEALSVDVVIESTGVFLTSESCQAHIKAGAKKVVMSAPAKDEETPTYLIGVNEKEYHGEKIISNASCTTNCIAPIIKVLHDRFGVQKSLMTTVHSYTADQNLVDGPHKDLRRARAAAINIVPTTTGAAKTVTRIIKELENKFDGLSIRVPTPVVSLSDVVAIIDKPTTVEILNSEFEKAANGNLKNILAVSDLPLVSSDLVGNSASAIVDLELTNVVGGNLVKIIAWYDNEWGYSNRLVEMARLITQN